MFLLPMGKKGKGVIEEGYGSGSDIDLMISR